MNQVSVVGAGKVPPDLHHVRALLDSSEGILLDWDGCVAFGNLPHLEGLKFLSTYQNRIAIVSNSSTIRPQDICQILAKSGINFPAQRIILAGHQALLRAASLKRPTMVFGSLLMKGLARELGIAQVKRDPEVIVLLRDTRFSYARLLLGANALRNGAHLIVSNPDLTHPGADGTIVPETGALLAAFRACVPDQALAMEIIGKPSAQLFRTACAALEITEAGAVMIGDNLATDIVGAKQLNMESILVSPGSSLSLAELC